MLQQGLASEEEPVVDTLAVGAAADNLVALVADTLVGVAAGTLVAGVVDNPVVGAVVDIPVVGAVDMQAAALLGVADMDARLVEQLHTRTWGNHLQGVEHHHNLY